MVARAVELTLVSILPAEVDLRQEEPRHIMTRFVDARTKQRLTSSQSAATMPATTRCTLAMPMERDEMSTFFWCLTACSERRDSRKVHA